MNKDLLTKVAKGNVQAHATLRRTTPASLTVFVKSGDKLDIPATLAAYQYHLDNGYPPDEWNDEPTLTFAQAFPSKVRRNPLTLKPVTPGLWTQLWESKNGHEMVAAIHWGIHRRQIQDSELELKGRVRRHLESPDMLLLDVLAEMKRDERQAQAAMDAVFCPVTQDVPPTVYATPSTPQQKGRMAALTDLRIEYERGGIDIARYLKLKESLEQGLERQEWTQTRITLFSKTLYHFSLSEIRTLAFNLGKSPDDLSARQSSAARELTMWAKRRSLLDHLAEQVKEMNPVRWAEFVAEWEDMPVQIATGTNIAQSSRGGVAVVQVGRARNVNIDL